MKIKDILNPLMELKEKCRYALRLRKCTDMIKGDIRQWKETDNYPTRRVVLKSPSGEGPEVSISMGDLIETYGFEPLDAFIFMDDLIKASTADDMRELSDLLGQLKSTACVHNGNVTPELLDRIRREQPGVWAAYQKLLAQEEWTLKEEEEQNLLNQEF